MYLFVADPSTNVASQTLRHSIIWHTSCFRSAEAVAKSTLRSVDRINHFKMAMRQFVNSREQPEVGLPELRS